MANRSRDGHCECNNHEIDGDPSPHVHTREKGEERRNEHYDECGHDRGEDKVFGAKKDRENRNERSKNI